MPGCTIGQVVLSTGLSERQIRYCEEKGFVQPDRTTGGHRLFSERDVLRLMRFAQLRRSGKSLRQAISVLENDSKLITAAKKPEPNAVRLFFGLQPREQKL